MRRAEVVADLAGHAAQLLDRRLRVFFLQAGDVDAGVVEVGADLDFADRGPAQVEVADVGAQDLHERVAHVLADAGGSIWFSS